MIIEGYCHCDFNNAAGFWYYDNNALLLWNPTSTSSRKFVCIFSTGISYHECSRISESYRTCKFSVEKAIVMILSTVMF